MRKTNATFANLPISKLKTDEGPFLPLSDQEFEELKKSIKEYGLVYPLVVTRDYREEDKYLILDGRNRYRALLALGQKDVPCFIVDVDFPQAYIISYETELFRRHLDETERQDAFKRRSELEKELVREYKRRILDNIEEADPAVKDAIKNVKDLSILIELYYISEKLAVVSEEVKEKILSKMFTKARNSVGESVKATNEEITKIKEERDKYRFKMQELKQRIKQLEAEKETLEKNYKKIAEEIEKRLRQEITAKVIKSSSQAEAAVREYKKVIAQNFAEEQAATRKKIKELTKMIDKLKEELEEVKREKARLESEKRRVINERDSLKLTLSEIKSEIQQVSIDPIISEISTLHRRIESLNLALKRALQSFKALPEETILHLKNLFRELDSEYEKLRNTVAEL